MFRWGIIGAGYVARKFAHALRSLPNTTVAVVYSRSENTARGFARAAGGTPWTVSIEEAVSRSDVDAFYIATPPTSHKEQALLVIAAGKPVLMEKPIAASYADALAIAEAARSAGVFAMEGMWTRFLPAMAMARSKLRSGALGEVRSLEGSFGLANLPSPHDNQFNAELGGGALLHRAIYPVAIALDLAGPAELVGSAATIGATGVDEDVVLTLRHENGALSTARASLRADLDNDFSVAGTGGRLVLDAPIYRPWRGRLAETSPAVRTGRAPRFERLREGGAAQLANRLLSSARGRPGRAFINSYRGNGYGHEAEAVMESVREGRTEHPLMTLQDSLALSRLLDQARACWTRGSPGGE